MRRIYFKVKDVESIRYKLDTTEGELLVSLRNLKGHNIFLRDATVKRTLTGGVYFLDSWGNYDKWFSDLTVSRKKLW